MAPRTARATKQRALRDDLSTVWELAWPAVALNGLQTVNSLLDTKFMGSLPKAALTAHGSALNVLFLMFSLGMAVSVASSAMVSRAYGAQRLEELREANRRCLTTAVGIAVILVAATLALREPMAHLLVPAGNPEARAMFVDFLTFYAFSLPGTAVITTLGGSMRGIGDTKSPMVISGLQILLHIALNFVFIFPTRTVHGVTLYGADMGLAGAGLAIAVSGTVSALVYLLWTGRTPLGNPLDWVLPSVAWLKRILNIALPAALQAILRVASFSVFTVLLAQTPTADDALGALRVGIAIESIMFMPAFGLSIAAGALVGQSLGAERPDRAERLGWICSHIGAGVVVALSIPIFIWAPEIASFLTGGNKPEMAREAVHYIRILIATEALFGYAMVLIGAMQGAGDTRRTLWITIATLWLLRVPLAWGLSLTPLGATGAWVAMSASQAAQGLLAMWFWRRGAWKSVKV